MSRFRPLADPVAVASVLLPAVVGALGVLAVVEVGLLVVPGGTGSELLSLTFELGALAVLLRWGPWLATGPPERWGTSLALLAAVGLLVAATTPEAPPGTLVVVVAIGVMVELGLRSGTAPLHALALLVTGWLVRGAGGGAIDVAWFAGCYVLIAVAARAVSARLAWLDAERARLQHQELTALELTADVARLHSLETVTVAHELDALILRLERHQRAGELAPTTAGLLHRLLTGQGDRALTTALRHERLRRTEGDLARVRSERGQLSNALSQVLAAPVEELARVTEQLTSASAEEEQVLLAAVLDLVASVERALELLHRFVTRDVATATSMRVPLDTLVAEATRRVAPSLDDHEIDVAVGVAAVDGDPELVTGVLEQLLHNVAVHTPPGTRAEVRARHVTDAERLVDHTARPDRDAATRGGIEVVVADDGPGIATTDLAGVLQPFRRGSEGHGLGLGLTLADRFLAAQGTVLEVDSLPGRGTVARFVLSGTMRPESADASRA